MKTHVLSLILFFAAEALIAGWEHSSLKLVVTPKRSQLWEMLSTTLEFSPGADLLSRLFSFGLLSWTLTKFTFQGVAADLPALLRVAIAVIAYDFLVYWKHRLFHVSDTFWILHEFHHSSTRVSLLTGYRNHPFEMVFSVWLIAFPIFVLVGQRTTELMAFPMYIVMVNLFVHSRIDWTLGWLGKYLLVTPRHHHLHHSKDRAQFSNYGFGITLWDRIFGTYMEPSQSIELLDAGLIHNRFEEGYSLSVYVSPVIRFYKECALCLARLFKQIYLRSTVRQPYNRRN